MIAYVETNFVLELAYLQEEHESCEEMLALVEGGRLSIAIPAFSVTEARMNLFNKSKKLGQFRAELDRQLTELARSKPYAHLPGNTRTLTKALRKSADIEKKRLEDTTGRVLKACRILPIQLGTIQLAIQHEARTNLSSQDALVFACIVEDLRTAKKGPKCFLTRNTKDFRVPDIERELDKFDCKLLTSFADGLGYIRSARAP